MGRLVNLAIVVLNLLACAIPLIETGPTSEATHTFLYALERVMVTFFVLEYAARLCAAESRLRQPSGPCRIIGLVPVVPPATLPVLPHFGLSPDPAVLKLLRGLRRFLTLFMLLFISSGPFCRVAPPLNPMGHTFGEAFYFTVVALTAVGFGNVISVSTAGRWLTGAMIPSGIVLIPWQAGRISNAWLRLGAKSDIICHRCSQRQHGPDASHCTSNGNIVYPEYGGDG